MIEQWHTVEEAERLWCPMMKEREVKVRKLTADRVEYIDVLCACIGPRCMAWVQHEPTEGMGGQAKGRCGMVAP